MQLYYMQIFELNSSRSIYELVFLATVINSPFHSYFLLCKVACYQSLCRQVQGSVQSCRKLTETEKGQITGTVSYMHDQTSLL